MMVVVVVMMMIVNVSVSDVVIRPITLTTQEDYRTIGLRYPIKTMVLIVIITPQIKQIKTHI
jgi:hypothetical protein